MCCPLLYLGLGNSIVGKTFLKYTYKVESRQKIVSVLGNENI